MNKKQLEKRNAQRQRRRELKNFRAANTLHTNAGKMGKLQEDIVLNPRRHKNLQNLAKENSKRYVRTMMLLHPELDN